MIKVQTNLAMPDDEEIMAWLILIAATLLGSGNYFDIAVLDLVMA